MADFHGKPMFLRAVEATEGLFDVCVVVTRHTDVAEICRSLSIPVVLHDLPHRNDTIRLGLEALGDVDCCMFVPGDQPLLRRCTVEIMLENWRIFQKLIFRPSFEDIPGSPVLFPRWAFPELLTLPEGKGGGYVAQKYPGSVHTIQVSTAFELADADTPETLEILRQFAK
jgi:molybdenum cofactor cytidylyltransferase